MRRHLADAGVAGAGARAKGGRERVADCAGDQTQSVGRGAMVMRVEQLGFVELESMRGQSEKDRPPRRPLMCRFQALQVPCNAEQALAGREEWWMVYDALAGKWLTPPTDNPI